MARKKTKVFKRELMVKVAELNRWASKTATKGAIELFVYYLQEEISKGRTVDISGIGVFKPVLKPARIAWNPSTQSKQKIPPRWKVSFTPARQLLNGLEYEHRNTDLDEVDKTQHSNG